MEYLGKIESENPKFKSRLGVFRAYPIEARKEFEEYPTPRITRQIIVDGGETINYYDDEDQNKGLSYLDFEIDNLLKQGVQLNEVHIGNGDRLAQMGLAENLINSGINEIKD